MERAQNERVRFIILWTVAGGWFPVVWTVLSPVLQRHGGSSIGVAIALAVLAWPVAALSQWPLLRERVAAAWLWPLCGIFAAVLSHVFHWPFGRLLMLDAGDHPLAWVLASVLAAALSGLGAGLAQSVAVARWHLNVFTWVGVVTLAMIVAALVGAVVLQLGGGVALMQGMGPSEAGPQVLQRLPFIVSIVLRVGVFGVITGWWLERRLSAQPDRLGAA